MKITRVYSPRLWAVSFIGSAIFCLVMVASIEVFISSLHPEQRIIAGLTLVLVTALSLAKAYIRIGAVRAALPEYRARLQKQMPAQLLLTTLTPLIFFINCVGALTSRTIDWRGTRYQLKSRGETVIISD